VRQWYGIRSGTWILLIATHAFKNVHRDAGPLLAGE